jgi:hypothetical protein
MAQKTTQPQPTAQPETPSNVSELRSSGSLFAMARTAQGRETFPNKSQFMGDIRQRLAQVADTAKKAGENSAETEKLADQSATRLYQARVAGMVTQEELNGLLVDIFGAVPKSDGTPGKTPAGTGGAIRKRITRAVQGAEFVNGADGFRFYETMDRDAVAPVIAAIGRTKKNEKGETVSDGHSLWHAYKLLGDIKSQGTVRLPFAFDPKKILGLVESLSEAGARDTIMRNPPLLNAYAGLMDQLRIIDQVDASETEAVADALGISDEVESEGGEQVAA